MNYNLVALAPNLSRAFEIAKTGNHRIALIANYDADPAPDKRDVQAYIDFYGITEDRTDPEIIVEITAVDPDSMFRTFLDNRSETLEDIQLRIDANQLSGITVKDEICSSSKALLKTAIDRLGLAFTDLKHILSVAKTIALMANSEKIKIEHVAEAVQYKSVKLENVKEYQL